MEKKFYELKVINKDGFVDDCSLLVEDIASTYTKRLSYSDKNVNIVHEDTFYFTALCGIRRTLEYQGKKIACKGSCLNVFPSGNLLIGLSAYVLHEGKHADLDDRVNIFDIEIDYTKLVSVDEQEAFYDKWLDSFD